MQGFFDGLKEGFGPVAGAVKGITGNISSIIQQVAAKFGWGSGPQLAAIMQIVGHESGGRPTAQNPTSTAYGLFQFLNGTWAGTGIGKTSDPASQALAGMRYIKQRYGNPTNAWAYWQRHHSYDRGGWLMPEGIGHNQTGSPEAVLTPDESSAFIKVAKALGKGVLGPLIGQVTFQEAAGSAREEIEELEFALRKARHGGRYALTGAMV